MLKAKYLWAPLVEGVVPDHQIYEVILKNRGIDDPDHFFSMGKEVLIDPYLLKGMDRAVSRILKAISADEKIVIYGDYDCDGITAISVLYRTLKKMKANVFFDLPNRFVDGYGLNMNAARKMIGDKVELVITVDNGITCVEEVALLKAHGIDTIITDHHEVKEVLPDAYEIIHPKISPNYPFKEIAGVMVAYKLASALSDSILEDLFDLVMIGTIADLMPLEKENQAMVNLGLIQMNKTTNLGLKKIIEYSHLELINETAIAFKIAPKINSSGRLGKAKEAVKLLISDSEREINDLILQIEEYHANRKDLTEEAFQLCEKLVTPEEDVIVIASTFLHEGVIGICAQKIAEKYQKSTVIITLDEEGVGKGSMRSFGGDNILKMLEHNKDLLIKFGGHSQAAGLQIKKENIDMLRMGLQREGSHDQPILKIDMEVHLPDVKVATIQKLQDNSFFTASFLFKNLTITKKMMMSDKHTKLICEVEGVSIDVLSFNSLEYFYLLEVGDIINVVGGLNINLWRKRTTIQIMIKDLECLKFQVLDFRNQNLFPDGVLWMKPSSFTISDETLLDGNLKQTLLEQKPKTIVLLPRIHQDMIEASVAKETYIRIYKAITEIGDITLFDLEQKTKYPVWIIKKALEVFLELRLIKKTEDGFSKGAEGVKSDLHTSPTYHELEDLKETADWLYQESISTIKSSLYAWTEAHYEF
ncbi:MAG: single-stranded-DNA-specific exonuclease RecJ [Firmicutes bacterium]|nr:single-stranded-DNA-specific exonuclease RecJ [Bacillota bacterium]